ncbi:hypothetical protein F5144DRAFT_570795 [Chaetomium tenue]|uniref:Uncharacterized protein n=1 Tax=Chaetomium tenue TaxID=1854479 RepID=A0ACB7P5C9_9PEZI|nr:hypothetical protein F5144DRAFT_570795 [Chaetomium globosum]
MPAVTRAVNFLTRTIQARQTFTFTNPPFPPFRQPDNFDDDDDVNPFRLDPEDPSDDNNHKLSAGTIAAIVISIVVFFIVITGLIVFFTHRRRKARRDVEMIVVKEASVSATAVTASGALDPPPPYVESHPGSPHLVQERRGSRSDDSRSGEEEDSEVMGSHATITDGLAPGRHTGLGTQNGAGIHIGSGTYTSSDTQSSSDIYRGPGSR